MLLVGVGLLAAVGCISFGAPPQLEAEEHRAAGYEANDRGDWATAIDEYTHSIELEPTERGYVGRAYAYGSRGEVDAAIADLTEAIALDDEEPAAFNQRALYYNQQGRWTEAVADLDRAIELRPERGDQYNGRALAHLELGNFALAVEDTTRAIELDPDSPGIRSYYHNRASAYRELGELRLALADLEQLVILDPGDPKARLEVVFAFAELGEVDEVLNRIEVLPGIAGNPAGRFATRAEALKRAGRLEDAIAEIDQAIELDPSSPLLLAGRAVMYAELGDVEQARRDYERALELANDPFLTMEIKTRLGQLEQASSD